MRRGNVAGLLKKMNIEHILKDRGYKFGLDWLGNRYAGDPHSETAWRAQVQVPLRFLLKNNQQQLEATASTKGGARGS